MSGKDNPLRTYQGAALEKEQGEIDWRALFIVCILIAAHLADAASF